MPSLVSPGISVQVIDESIYAVTSVATVPLVVFATAEDKMTPSGTTATGTTAANAEKLYLIGSQRELVNTYGAPAFYKDSNSTPLHGYEINEYGLLAAYSALGVSNRVYMLRADINLAQLIGTSVRPTQPPESGTIWLDLSETRFGIFEWDVDTKTFTNIDSPILITSTTNLASGAGSAPKASIGQIGQYAVDTTSVNNPMYVKTYDNSWQQLGSLAWELKTPSLIASNANPTLETSDTLVINTVTVTITAATVANLAAQINAANITGVVAWVSAGYLNIAHSDLATNDGSSVNGRLTIANGSGTMLTTLGLTAGTYRPAGLTITSHTNVPAWKPSDALATGGVGRRPSGSVWIKTTSPNAGANWSVKTYNATTEQWTTNAASIYSSDTAANDAYDSAGGGINIAQGSTYVLLNPESYSSPILAEFRLQERTVSGITEITGTTTSQTFVSGNTFLLATSEVGSSSITNEVTVTLSGTTATLFVQSILAAGLANLTAEITSTGAIKLTHTAGGTIRAKNVTGTALTTAGFTSATTGVKLRSGDSYLIMSNWSVATYTASADTPTTYPESGTYWYDSTVDEVDIMIHNGTTWKGYQTITNDTRGYNLSLCDPAGPIVTAAAPTTQSDGTALSYGDLWIDTGDLENYPAMYRYDNVGGSGKWQAIDTADQTSEAGVVFGDARWDTTGTTDIVTGTKPSIAGLLTSNYLDIDAIDPALYPRGMLLWNTRRSGYNVKKYMPDYFNETDFPDDVLPTVVDAWVNAVGNKANGSPFAGRKAVRACVAGALAAAIDNTHDIRTEERNFNLTCCPGYPEVVANMVALGNDRKNTTFVIADTPARLAANSTAILNWADGNAEDSITTADPYMGVYYPWGVTNNPFTTGNTQIVVPPSHMALRLIIRNDDVAYPWFAPAGLRRGLIDNATRVGYIDADSGELQTVSLIESMRDTLYENKINPACLFPGTGLVMWGQKTMNPYSSALDRVNVARLIVYIRERLGQIVKPFLFEPNDKITRDEAKQVVESLMNDLVAKRGLYDYLVICDESNNTTDRIDRNELYIDVAIEPMKAVEFIYIPLRIKNTGEIKGG
jgi:hypothetical protein